MDALIFSWSALVDDDDFDGRGDVLVTTGAPGSEDDATRRVHENTNALQGPDGTFETAREELGLEHIGRKTRRTRIAARGPASA